MFALTLSKTVTAMALAVAALGTASVAQASPGASAAGKHPDIIAVKHPDIIAVKHPDIIAVKHPDIIFLEGQKHPDIIFLEGQKHPDASKHPDIFGVLRARDSARTDVLRSLIVIRKAG